VKKLFVLAFIAALFVLLSGCVQPPQCGDGTCDSGETPETCAVDCGGGILEETPPMPPSPEGVGEEPPSLPF